MRNRCKGYRLWSDCAVRTGFEPVCKVFKHFTTRTRFSLPIPPPDYILTPSVDPQLSPRWSTLLVIYVLPALIHVCTRWFSIGNVRLWFSFLLICWNIRTISLISNSFLCRWFSYFNLFLKCFFPSATFIFFHIFIGEGIYFVTGWRVLGSRKRWVRSAPLRATPHLFPP